jgi:thiosulfate/3-mercaptopyruvate sulfurtransferase
VAAGWLREQLGDAALGERFDEPSLRIVDCRYRLGEPGAGETLWLEGHIPGASFLDLDRDLAAPPGERGRHPLPDAGAFESAARRAGIGQDALVVAYDEAGEGGAARLWWLLRHFGHDRVTVLDGGLRGWREDGGDLRGGPEQIEPGDFRARAPGAMAGIEELSATASIEELTGLGAFRAHIATESARPTGLGALPGHFARKSAQPAESDGPEPGPGPGPEPGPELEPGPGPRPGPVPVLLDARAPERYRGETEPIDSVAGHIPGAVNLPFAELVPGGRFLPPEELRARFEAAGVVSGNDAVAYCGSGVTACVLVLAAEVAGIGPTRLYPGSWSEWSRRGLPVERG